MFPSLMTDLVNYHHPDDELYSLAYVILDRDEIDADLSDLGSVPVFPVLPLVSVTCSVIAHHDKTPGTHAFGLPGNSSSKEP